MINKINMIIVFLHTLYAEDFEIENKSKVINNNSLEKFRTYRVDSLLNLGKIAMSNIKMWVESIFRGKSKLVIIFRNDHFITDYQNLSYINSRINLVLKHDSLKNDLNHYLNSSNNSRIDLEHYLNSRNRKINIIYNNTIEMLETWLDSSLNLGKIAMSNIKMWVESIFKGKSKLVIIFRNNNKINFIIDHQNLRYINSRINLVLKYNSLKDDLNHYLNSSNIKNNT